MIPVIIDPTKDAAEARNKNIKDSSDPYIANRTPAIKRGNQANPMIKDQSPKGVFVTGDVIESTSSNVFSLSVE